MYEIKYKIKVYTRVADADNFAHSHKNEKKKSPSVCAQVSHHLLWYYTHQEMHLQVDTHMYVPFHVYNLRMYTPHVPFYNFISIVQHNFQSFFILAFFLFLFF